MGATWQFISSDQVTGKVTTKNRGIVREAAMRAYRRSQRLQRQKQRQMQQRSSHKRLRPTTLCTHADPDWLALPPDESNNISKANTSRSNLMLTLEIGSALAFDPFFTTPLSSRHEGLMLFTHFIYNIVPTIQAFHHQSPQHPLGTILISYIITDPLFIEAILFHAAVHVDVTRGRSWCQTTWYHRGQLMHQISERMNSSQDTASDALILGVGMLGACGNITGDVTQDSVHREALQHMIRVRGGIDKLGCQGTLSTLLSIGDLISVTISGSKPGVECPRLDSAPSPLFDGLWRYGFLTKDCTSDASLESSGMRIREIIQLISRFATIYRTSYKVLSTTSSHMTTFTHVCCAAEHQLLSLEVIPPAGSDTSSVADVLIYEAARNAAKPYGTVSWPTTMTALNTGLAYP
ncbi:hypothetical protein O1611_g3627 [Lasiodiplodia mahajangana]|uniref:Uncharacterized protein n=1 Tax=Lasiodiplodia mahajangana TaxID=1108764 RepID=A0ACC2JRV4_9PEZI|nr:hypothetical protein O1611_g3627 [Lasiodiplodia mahajangana]